MMIINWLMVFCLMHSASSQVDLKIVPEAEGTAVVHASINAITEAEIFSISDEQMLRRIAYTETNDGKDPNTYPADYHGGIWRLSEEKYTFTKQVDQSLLDKIRMTLDINWPETSWMDLRKPLWSALAARLYLHYIIGSIPLSVNHNEQAMYWFNNYRTSNKAVADYLNSIANLTLSEACSVSGMDLFFVLDESGSVGFSNYQTMKMFVNQWIDGLDIGENDVRVGLMAFSSNPRVHFNLNKYYNKATMKQAVTDINYGGGGTDTASALTTTRSSAFTTANGGRPSAGVPRVIVVVTDGKSNSFGATQTAAAELHNERFIVFAIGISGANVNELNAIASRRSYVAFIDAFDPVRLQALQVDASDTTCRASPEIPLNDTVIDTIDEGETKYLNYHLPANTTGITIQVDVRSGTIILYASSTTENPNEADHDVKYEINNETEFRDIFIDATKLRNPDAERIFIALTSAQNSSNSTFAISAKLTDFIVDPVVVFIPEVRPSVSRVKGSIITLSCIAGGKPTPSIDWLKDGIKLLPSQKIAMDFYSESNITTSELIISYLDVNDSGTYECLGYHTVPNYGVVNASSPVSLNITSASVFIEPTRGNMLGGTLIRTRGVFFRNIQASVKCSFDGGTGIPGIIVNETEAVCVSPRFDEAGSKPFLLYIDGRVVRSSIVNFYATHYADLADVNVSPMPTAINPRGGGLLVDSFQNVNITWNEESLLSSFSDKNQVKISIEVSEACILAGGILNLDEVTPRKLITENKADIISPTKGLLPQFSMLCNQQQVGSQQPKSLYSIVLLKVIGISQHDVIKKLQMLSSKNKIAIWSHVLIRKYPKSNVMGESGNMDKPSEITGWNTSPISKYHPIMFDNNTPCPCTKSQIIKDGLFEESSKGKKIIDNFLYGSVDNHVICYDVKQNNGHQMNGFQECCYHNSTELLLAEDRVGSANVYSSSVWENHFIYDIAPFIRFAEMNELHKYYSKRPKSNCKYYNETKIASLNGDPHMRTLDGLEYTFNGRGEFILMNTVNGSFSLQGRMESLTNEDGTQSSGTVFSALVAKEIDSDTVEFRKGGPLPTVHVNDIQIDISPGEFEQYEGVVTTVKSDGTLRASFSIGVSIEVKQRNGFLSSVIITAPESFKGLTEGLMGNYNDDPNDDLHPHRSTISLSVNSSMEKIHYDFGLTWIIKDESMSLFSYETGDSFQTFYDPSYTPLFEPVFTDPLLEAEAKEICQGNWFCLYDIAATKNKEIGKETLEEHMLITERLRVASAPVVCDPPCDKGVCVSNNTCNCPFGFTGSLCDTEDVCAYNPPIINCNEPIPGWVYDAISGKCEFGGCPGRGKIFATLADCVENCQGCSDLPNPTQERCIVDPCQTSSCNAFPHSNCEVDSCDSCVARFTYGAREVTDICELECEIDNKQFEPSDCLTAPCDGKLCPNLPEATCIPDYCGGKCDAKFVNSFGVDVTDQCTDCPPGRSAHQCPHDLCDHQKCHNYPNAVCRLDTCGLCKARFYLENDTEVTEQCEHCNAEGQVFDDCVSACPKTCSNYSDNHLCSQPCKPGCQCPGNMVLDEVKNKCVLVESCSCHCDPLPDNCSSITIKGNDTCQCQICTDCSVEGMMFNECMTCPRTCSEVASNSILSCSEYCKAGCQCTNGKVFDELTSSCVERMNCREPDRCTLPAVAGSCKGNLRRYYYNTETKKCETFKYTGCMKNKNNFFSLHDCEIDCSSLPPTCSPSFCVKKRTSMCVLPIDSGDDGCSPGYVVSNCQACYYSSTPFRTPSCAGNCVASSNSGYNSGCIKDWGLCVKNALRPQTRLVPLEDWIDSNFRCVEYKCTTT